MSDRAELVRIQRWLTQAVIGMNLCPFAAHPWNQNQVRIAISDADTELGAEAALLSELQSLSNSSPDKVETTLLATINLFSDFFDYCLFLEHANALLKREGLKGKIQIASFHPKYQFSGSNISDKENYTNRAPYPIFHLLREDSLEKAISLHPDTESIYRNNIQRLRSLGNDELHRIFEHTKT